MTLRITFICHVSDGSQNNCQGSEGDIINMLNIVSLKCLITCTHGWQTQVKHLIILKVSFLTLVYSIATGNKNRNRFLQNIDSWGKYKQIKGQNICSEEICTWSALKVSFVTEIRQTKSIF